MTARPYRLGKRQADVDDTRERIVDAARELFGESAFNEVTLADVAKRAGVSRATVYYQFESKFGLLDAVFAAALQRAGYERIRQAREHRDAALGVRLYVKEVCSFWSREHAPFRNIFGLAAVDQDARRAVDRYDGRRKELITWLVKRLEDQGKLRKSISQKNAVDVLWMLTGFRAFDQLHSGSGLSVRATAKLLSDLAAAALIEPPAA
jgi:AcrR family transcriptional regulator